MHSIACCYSFQRLLICIPLHVTVTMQCIACWLLLCIPVHVAMHSIACYCYYALHCLLTVVMHSSACCYAFHCTLLLICIALPVDCCYAFQCMLSCRWFWWWTWPAVWVGDGRREPSEHQALGSYSTLCTHCTHSVLQPPAKLTRKKLREKSKLGNHFKTLENIWELQKKNLKKGIGSWEFMLECGN